MTKPANLPDYDYEVKSWPAFYTAMVSGKKKHDMRDKRDRAYKIGDRLKLREYDPFSGAYTGREAVFKVTYITSNDTPCAMSSAALDRDFCILSMELLGHTDSRKHRVDITIGVTDDMQRRVRDIVQGERPASGGILATIASGGTVANNAVH